jgi:hypothetical protein
MKDEKKFLKGKNPYGRTPFCQDLIKKAPELKKKIEDKSVILMTKEGLREMMNVQYRENSILNIFWDTKTCLWFEGIVVETKKQDHGNIIQFRARTPEDFKRFPY